MEIYNRINEHKFMDNNDLINIFNNRLKRLNLYNKDDNVVFLDDNELYFRYNGIENRFEVSNNYKFLTLRPIIEDKLVKVVKKKNEENTFLIDAYNLDLLTCPYHEVRHAEQYEIIINSLEPYNILIDKSLEYMTFGKKFYHLNHPIFLSEHDAELNSMLIVLSDIENGKLKVSLNSLYFFNTIIAYFLLRSRGYKIENSELIKKSVFKSPLNMLSFYNKSLYLKNEIDKEEYSKVNCCINKIRKKNNTEYDRIISGDNISDETINELFLIAKGRIKTENVFKYFENKELDKNNNDYVKKLVLS